MSDIVTIRCRENGPLVLQGPFRLVDHEGREYPLPQDRPVVALCRCGASRNKPFCDGSHRSCGFDGGSPAPRTPLAPASGESGRG